MTDEEQAAWDAEGIGQPSRDPDNSIRKFLLIVGGAIVAALVIACLIGRFA